MCDLRWEQVPSGQAPKTPPSNGQSRVSCTNGPQNCIDVEVKPGACCTPSIAMSRTRCGWSSSRGWTDADALRTHFHAPASAAFVHEVAALADGSPELAIYDAHPVTV